MPVLSDRGNGGIRLSRLIDDIAALLHDREEGSVSLGDLTEAAGEGGFGLIFVLFALPMVVPVLPPGTAAAVGLLFAVLALQMLMGRRKPWLPSRWRTRPVSPKVKRLTLERGVPVLSRITRWSRPRWAAVTGGVGMRCAAVCAFAMGIVMVMPIPFMNTLPALAVLCIGVGLISRDGLFLAAGIGASGIIVALLTFAVAAGGSLFGGLMEWLPDSMRVTMPF